MFPEASTRRQPQHEAVDTESPAIDAGRPADVKPGADTTRTPAGLNKRLRRAARKAFRLMGED